MTRHIKIGAKTVTLPIFAATTFLDQASWFWTYGVNCEALLMSYDVLGKDPALLTAPLANSLDFDGLILIDSGAYGQPANVTADVLYATQRRLRADIAIALDRPVSEDDNARTQWRKVRETVDNATLLKTYQRAEFRREAPVQGDTTRQRRWCAEQLASLHFRVIGVPVGAFSQAREYNEAAQRLVEIRARIPANTIIHAMGCGSRTTMAILASLGAEIFDSSNWFKRAVVYGETFPPVTTCQFGAPLGKPECAFCQTRQRKPVSAQAKAKFNLIEVLKELTRIRCAQDEDAMPQYLEHRIPKTTLTRLRHLLTPPPVN
jgi:Queuine tRNA-ribosyltransferase